LDLRQNPVGDAGAASLGSCLGGGLAQHVESLHLGWCGVGPKGCRAIADGVKKAHAFSAVASA